MVRNLFLSGMVLVSCLSCREMRNADGEPGANRPSPLVTTEKQVGLAQLRMIYSSPGVKERKIWGHLVPYNKIWRTGANDATIFETSSDLMISGTKLPRGKYSLFTIPGDKEWTVILNKVWDQWGAYNYDASKDAIRMQVKTSVLDSLQERMKFEIGSDGNISFRWEFLEFSFLVEPS